MRKAKEVESLDILDAVKPFALDVMRDDIWGSRSKAISPLSLCTMENTGLRHPGVLKIKITKTMGMIVFKSNPHVALRYNLDQDGKKISEINDDVLNGGKKVLYKLLTKPIRVWLLPPRRNLSLAYLRSEEFKQKRQESKERRKGLKPRPYKSPAKKGFRSGIGTSHMWPTSK